MYKLKESIHKVNIFKNHVLNIIASNRGVNLLSDVYPTKSDMTSINKLKNITKGAKLLIEHMKLGNKIFINTDLDCDGVTSASIFYITMVHVFKYPTNNICVFTNERRYKRGINDEALVEVDDFNPSLFITADHGSSDNDYIKKLKDKCIDTIITDHHLFDDYPTNANVFINPQQDGCKYDKTISGAVVLYLLLLKVHQLLKSNIDMDILLPICAISTLGDRMNMSTKTNRYLVQEGIYILNTHPRWSSIKKLYGKGKDLTQKSLDFEIIPSINSGGRLGNSRLGFNMLISILDINNNKSVKEVKILKEKNLERKKIQQELTKEALKQYKHNKVLFSNVVVLCLDKMNGVNGLIAGNIATMTNKPTIVGSIADDDFIYGSARSINNIPFLKVTKESVSKIKGVANGHQYAFGIRLPNISYTQFITDVNNRVGKLSIPTHITKVDMDDSRFIDLSLAKSLIELEPYGIGFEKPLFVIKGYVLNVKKIGRDKEHIKFDIRNGYGTFNAIWFNYNTPTIEGIRYEVVCELGINDFGKDTLQLLVKEIYK